MASLNILEWIKNKIDKTQIKNSLTETVVGNVLDSTQGKVLNDKVGVLEVDRGYLTTKVYVSTDTKTITECGKYLLNGGIDMPFGIESQGTYWQMDVTGSTNLLYQEMACVRGSGLAIGKKFYRICNLGAWGSWKEVATSEQVNVLSTDRGYLTSKIVAGVSVNTLNTNGKYILATNVTDVPVSGVVYFCEVTAENSITFKQTLTRYVATADTYTRLSIAGVWQPWSVVATTEKVDITPYMQNGWVIGNTLLYNKYISRSGDNVTIHVRLASGLITGGTIMFKVPASFVPSRQHPVYFNNPATGANLGVGYISGENVVIYTLSTSGDVDVVCNYTI